MATKIYCDVCGLEAAWTLKSKSVVIDAPEVLHKPIAVRLRVMINIEPINSEADLDVCAACHGLLTLEAVAQLIPGGIPALDLTPKPAFALTDGTVVRS